LNDADECELDGGDHRIEFGATFAQRGHTGTRNRFTTKLSSGWQLTQRSNSEILSPQLVSMPFACAN
jgi:hypothetical protein